MNGKRDVRLMRAILEHVEGDTSLGEAGGLRRLTAFEGFSEPAVLLHYALLIEEKYLMGNVSWGTSPATVFARRMTWKGYDYLEELRKRLRQPMSASY